MYGTEKEKHLGGYLNVRNIWGDPGTWAPEIWNKIIKDYNVESVLDVGCGLGYSCKYFAQKNLDVTGVEGGTNAINNSVFSGKVFHNDYTVSHALSDEFDFEFDLVWCCEFVEHVEEKFMENFLHDFKTGKYVAMTFAEPGQPGFYHVNCQYQEYWMEKLESIGFKLNKEYTETLRKMANQFNNNSAFPHSGHLQRLLFFEK